MNKNDQVDQAFILAAGFAKRMRPMTDCLPKPLVQLGGRPLLSHIVDKLVQAKVKTIIINGHHCIEKMHEYMPIIRAEYPDIKIILSEEDDILETGGGAVQALEYLDTSKPFYMINGDAYWVDAPTQNTLETLQSVWNTVDADMVLMLQPTNNMPLGKTVGDYDIAPDGTAERSTNQTGTHMFAGVRIVHPRILDGYDKTCFSFLKVMDKAESLNTLYGYDHKGEWYHISTPQDLDAANNLLFAKAS